MLNDAPWAAGPQQLLDRNGTLRSLCQCTLREVQYRQPPQCANSPNGRVLDFKIGGDLQTNVRLMTLCKCFPADFQPDSH